MSIPNIHDPAGHGCCNPLDEIEPTILNSECVKCGTGADCFYTDPKRKRTEAYCVEHFLDLYETEIRQVEEHVMAEHLVGQGKYDIRTDDEDFVEYVICTYDAPTQGSSNAEFGIMVRSLERPG